ncbi:hypothetical protein [Psychrobacter pulmonis]|uniref:hypothetical protein n=1 Tax=Psychrobacter pulmonis TaxID=228654 RepID=UPI001918CE3A|nr:hypothetical protein [Psychrobacter pulmonis]
MSKKSKATVTVLMLLLSINAFAGVLMQQWTSNTDRYCKYSDGKVVKMNFGSVCSVTN